MKLNELFKWTRLAATLGWQDLRQAYRRTTLGQLWITLGMAFSVGTIGVVFGLIFKIPLNEFLPYLTTGIICWTFLSGLVTDSCLAFIAGEPLIKQIRFPLFVHVGRVVWRQILTLAHNLAIFPIVLTVFGVKVTPADLLFLPGLALSTLALGSFGAILAVASARYRDIPPIVNSAMQVVFYVTPVMWLPSLLPQDFAHILLGYNPMYHLLQIVRLPMLGIYPTLENWLLAAVFTVVMMALAAVTLRFGQRKVAYWV